MITSKPEVEAERRKKLIARVEWNEGGYGFGICSVANSMLWDMDRPSKGKPDLRSTIAVSGSPDKYTTEELEKIAAFADVHDAEYDRLFRYRRGCNMIIIDKQGEDRWLRKRMSWREGPMFSKSLDEAIEVFTKKRY